MRVALFFQGGNFIGPEYYDLLKYGGVDVTAFSWGQMSKESVAREVERTGGLRSRGEISTFADVSCWGDHLAHQMSWFDVCVNGGIGRKLVPDFLSAPRWGWLNVHPGSLPDFRGSSCPEWAKLLGKPVVCTAHKMDENIDAGPVVHASEYVYPLEYSYHQFRAHIYTHCAVVLLQALKKIEAGFEPLPQIGDGTTWPPMPPEVLSVVKRRFFPNHPGVV